MLFYFILFYFSGEDYLPFAEIPSLRNMVLTGEDDGDMSYLRMREQGAIAPGASGLGSNPPADNNTVVPFGQKKASGFKPVYDWDVWFSNLLYWQQYLNV